VSVVVRRAGLLLRLARWLVTRNHFDLDYRPDGLGEHFVSARTAAGLVPDRSVVLCCGIAAHHRPAILYRAIRERYTATQHPAGLTWCGVGGLGGRGRSPGTLEELGIPGLVTTAILGHLETVKSFLELASQGHMQLSTLPQGQYAFLIEGQAAGRTSSRSPVGVGSFLDPRVGPGSRVTSGTQPQLVEAAGDELNYRLPRLDVAILAAPHADVHGNIYIDGAVCVTEIRDAARAARANGGTVIALVADIVAHDPERIYLPATNVDAIVVDPRSEQTGTVPQRRPWPGLTLEGTPRPQELLDDMRFVNRLAGITPTRTPTDRALARFVATIMADSIGPGSLLNIGVGLPEEVARLAFDAGLTDTVTFSSETGVIGGIPASGVFFGAAVNPRHIDGSATVFHLYERGLDFACFGMLEADSDGNVNVSRRGPDPLDDVGPGGLPDIAHHARTVVFMGAFARGEKLGLRSGLVRVRRQGTPKLVPAVREITFSGPHALRRGQQVWYATPRCLLRLTETGLELAAVMPGIDIERDILQATAARILLPTGAAAAIPVLGSSVTTGQGFTLTLTGKASVQPFPA
jgi:propionate CoA-transferase